MIWYLCLNDIAILFGFIFHFQAVVQYDCDSNSPGWESSDKPCVLGKDYGEETDRSLASRSTISFAVISFLANNRMEIWNCDLMADSSLMNNYCKPKKVII